MLHDAYPVTTIDEVLVPETSVATERGRRVWPRLLIGFLVGFVLCIGIAGGALLAWDASYEGRVLPGVDVAGVDVSGLDYDQASGALETALQGYAVGRVVVHTSAGDVAVPFDRFSRRPDITAMVDAAMRAGRSGDPLERAVAEVRLATSHASIEPVVTLDRVALANWVDNAVAKLQRPPVDGHVAMTPEGIQVSPARDGRTFDGAAAAAAALEVLARPSAPAEVVVDAAAVSIKPAHGDRETALAKAAAERMIGKVVVTRGKKTWKIKAATVRSWIGFETTADGSPWPVVDESAIPASLKKVAKALKRSPASATYLKTRGGKIVGVVAASDGRRLDKAATATAIAETLAQRAMGATVASVKAQVEKVPPKLSTAEALKKGAPLMQRLGSWKTWFPVGERNFNGANIWLPAKIIDGTVLMPGQRFEWWRALGPVTPARGFGPGGFIAGNHTEPTGALGGGMCSSSTTLFNAALRAGLKMGARANHKYYIDRYPLGLDATVSKSPGGGTQTVSFTNDMKDPIVIRTFRYRAGGVGWVRYEIWGIPDGRKVSISKPSVWNVRKATTRTVYVSNLPKGVRKQTEYPANGMSVSVNRVVRRDGKIIHRNTYRTNYVLWNGRIEIGR
jgi:vancomycin resistance protein YoaR